MPYRNSHNIVVSSCTSYSYLVCEYNFYVRRPIGVNPGGLGVATSPDFGLGGLGVPGGSRGSLTGLGKYYSLSCTESTLERVFFRLFYKK